MFWGGRAAGLADEQTAGAKHKRTGVMRIFVFAVGPLVAESAQVTSGKLIYEGALERKKADRTSKGTMGTNKLTKTAALSPAAIRK